MLLQHLSRTSRASRQIACTATLRRTLPLLNSFRTSLPEDAAKAYRQAGHSDFQEQPPPELADAAPRRPWWGITKVLLGGLGWVLFFGVLSRMNYMYTYLDFLDVAFPRKLHALRLCFDILPPDYKIHLVREFRKRQRLGYGDSLFEYLLEYNPDVMSATDLSAPETLRRLNYVSALVYEAGEDSDMLWRDLLASHAAHQNMTQAERLTSILAKAHTCLVNEHGMPLYAGQSIFGDMYEQRKDSILSFPAVDKASKAASDKSANDLPRPGWRLL